MSWIEYRYNVDHLQLQYKMNPQRKKAIELMMEDLHTAHHEIRSRAKGEGCENELNTIKQQLLDYLNFLNKMN